MTIKRKLAALNYTTSEINVNNQKEFRKLVAWVEENKIKRCNNETRRSLNDIGNQDWDKAFVKYLNDLRCPLPAKDKEACLEWILGYAISSFYLKDKDKYNKHAENIQKSNVPSIVADNPLDKLDFTSNEFKQAINNVAALLKIQPHDDPLLTLEACSKIILHRLNFKTLEKPDDLILKGAPFPYEQADSASDYGDSAVNKAAQVLRLLYIQDLRNLQTKANECIVSVQSITANPKTDTKLGKVGI